MKDETTQFLKFSRGTRPEFHEPDDQGIKYIGTVGTVLDNAFGSSICPQQIYGGYQEILLFFLRGNEEYAFNLATLLSLAKRGAEAILAETTPDT